MGKIVYKNDFFAPFLNTSWEQKIFLNESWAFKFYEELYYLPRIDLYTIF